MVRWSGRLASRRFGGGALRPLGRPVAGEEGGGGETGDVGARHRDRRW